MTASDLAYVRSRPPGRRPQTLGALTLLRALLHACAPHTAGADVLRPGGKPVLRGGAVDFSVSHSRDRVAVAVATHGRVGVDLQHVEDRWDVAAMAALVLHPAEVERALRRAGRGAGGLTAGALAEAWARKEAYVKLTGEGVGPGFAALDTTSVTRDAGVRLGSLLSAGYALALAHAPGRARGAGDGMLSVVAHEPRVPLRPAVEALPAYVPGARILPGAAAYKLSSNENPYPPLPSVLAAIADAAADTNRYPDMYATELTEALAASLGEGVTPEQVVVGNGSVAVLAHVLQAVVRPGDEVVFPWRSFEAYPITVTVAGGTAVRVPLLTGADAGRLDLPAMADAITERTRVVLVCTPNNPTGPVVHRAELDAFLARVPSDVLVVIDEAYLEFVRDPEAPDGLALLAAHPNVVLLRTFSKAYGLAGLRVGYAVARPRLAAGIRAVSTPFGVSHVAQRAAIASLGATDELLSRVEHLVGERTRVVGELRAQGWELPDTQANFVWFDLGERTTARAADATSSGVLVRPFAGEGLRVSIGEREANDLFLKVAAGWR